MRRLLEDFGGVYMQGEGGKKKKRGKKDGDLSEGSVANANVGAAAASVGSAVAGVATKKKEKFGKDQKEPTGNCRFEKGKCPFGPKCRFSHGTTTAVAVVAQAPVAE